MEGPKKDQPKAEPEQDDPIVFDHVLDEPPAEEGEEEERHEAEEDPPIRIGPPTGI